MGIDGLFDGVMRGGYYLMWYLLMDVGVMIDVDDGVVGLIGLMRVVVSYLLKKG